MIVHSIKTLCILLVLFCLSGCGEANSVWDSIQETDQAEVEDELEIKDEKIASLEEKLHNAEVRIGFLGEGT